MPANSATVADVISVAESFWPPSGAEDWDAIGLLSGDPASPVDKLHLTVDAVPEVVDEAVDLGAQLLLAHHPLLLRGVTAIAETEFKGSVLARLIRGGCALYATHTNADVVETGTSAELAKRLGLLEVEPISALPGANTGIGRVGNLAEPMALGRLARLLAEILPPTATGVRVSGGYDQKITRVAVCAGAGDSYLDSEAVRTADVYVTSDLRHHPASAFRETAKLRSGPALIDISHWAAEWLWLDVAAEQLRSALPGVEVSVSDLRTDPWDFTIVQ